MSDFGYAGRDPMYAGMSLGQWVDMLLCEDPDDRAIREAHGIGYDADFEDPSIVCANGCGEKYPDISSGKMRTCAAAPCA